MKDLLAVFYTVSTVVLRESNSSTAIRTTSMYLRAAKTEAEEAGESTEGMAESVSKLREEFLALTGGKVDIQLDENTFKSTYQIVSEMAAIWDQLTDISQANILERMGGKRNSNVVAALISNFATAEGVIETAANATGSALEENEKYLDSIAGRLAVFEASFEGLSATIINSNLVKGAISFGTGILDIINEIASALGALPPLLAIIGGALGAKNVNTILSPFMKSGNFGVQTQMGIDISSITAYNEQVRAAANNQIDLSQNTEELDRIISDTMGNASRHARELVRSGEEVAGGVDGIRTALHGVRRAAIAATVKQIAFNAAISFGIGLALSLATKAISALINAEKEARENMTEDAEVYDNAAESIGNYETKVTDLINSLNSGSLSERESYEARRELLSIQEDVIKAYGLEANALDLLNVSAEEAKDSLRGVTEELAKTKLAENASAIEKARQEMEKTRASAVVEFGYTHEIGSDIVSDIEEIISNYEEASAVYIDKGVDGVEKIGVQVSGTAKEIQGVITELSADFRELERRYGELGYDFDEMFSGSPEVGLEKELERVNEILDNYEANYNAAITWTIATTPEYGNIMDSITEAREAYQDAIAGDYDTEENRAKAITAALEQMNAAREAFLQIQFPEDDAGVQNYIQSIFDAFNEASATETLRVDVVAEFKGNGNNTIRGINDEIEKFVDENGDIKVSDILNVGIEAEAHGENYDDWTEQERAYNAIAAAADEYGVTVETLLGIVSEYTDLQNDMVDSTKSARASILDLTSAYSKWKAAQESDEDNPYEDLTEALEQIKEGLETGKVGTAAFEAAVTMLVPEVNREDVAAYVKTMERYLTEDSAGMSNFLNDMIAAGLLNEKDGQISAAAGLTLDAICEALTLTPDMVKAIFNELSDYGVDVSWLDDAVESFEARLREISEGGTVDLLVRPTVDVSQLEDAGWEGVAEDAASVFATTFSNDAEDVAINFTPVITDKNGNVTRILTPEELENYANAVINGARTDNLNLQIGAEFKGEDAVDRAAAEIEEINELYAKYFATSGVTSDTGEQTPIEAVTEDTKELGTEIDTVTAKVVGDFGIEEITLPSLKGVHSWLMRINNVKLGDKTLTIKTEADSGVPELSFPSVTLNPDGRGSAYGTTDSKGGRYLVGELGRELVVSDDRYYTVGELGAEFVNLKKGDIVFNHRDTEKILAGQTGARGKALVSGNAAVTTGDETSSKDSENIYINGGGSGVDKLLNNITTSAGAATVAIEDMSDALDELIAQLEHQIFVLERTGGTAEEIIAVYRRMQEAVHNQANEYRRQGAAENSEYIRELQQQWWEYQDAILQVRQDAFDDYLTDSRFGIDILTNDGDTGDALATWRGVLRAINEEIDYYTSLGYDTTSDIIQSLMLEAWDAENSIQDVLETVVSDAQDAVDDLQNVYTTLFDAAQEYNTAGFLSIDTLQSIIDLGVEYLSFLYDENGQITINEENIKKMVAAKTEQLAVETALSYVAQLRAALDSDNTAELERLLSATAAATNATWGLVYANLGLLNLDGDQYSRALNNINTLRAMADNAINNIGASLDADRLSDYYDEAADSLGTILDLVMELIKHEKEQQIEALEEQIDRYREIIDLKKQSLEASKDEGDYTKEVAKRIKEIAALQTQIDKYKLEGTRESLAQAAALEEELAEKQGELADYQADYSLEKQQTALDAEADAFEKAKQDEIAAVENTISSTEKLYRLAIERITTQWGTLQDQLITWNYEYGSMLESELVDAWNAASRAVQEYGGYLEAVSAISALQGSSSSGGSYNTIGNTGNYDTSSTNDEMVRALVNRMKTNSTQWPAASESRRGELEEDNRKHAAQIAGITGQSVTIDRDGVWWIGGRKLYEVYHKGGIAGGESSLKQDEVMAILKKGEPVLDKEREEGLYKIIDFAEVLSERFGKAIDITKLNTAFGVGKAILPSLSKLPEFANANSSFEFNPVVNVNIQHSGEMTDSDAERIGRIASQTTLNELSDAFNKRGIGRIGNAALKQ